MSHYEQRLADDKAAIRERITKLGNAVCDAVHSSVAALLAGDHARSYQIILDDLPINRESRSIDRACHAFVARHLPSAGHLRFVSSVMRMNVELERVGDYAASISRHATKMAAPPTGKIASDMTAVLERGSLILRDAITAFATGDADLARDAKPGAYAMQSSFDAIYTELTNDPAIGTREGARLLSIFNKLERVGDQAKNICEETLFELLGETKAPKRYRVLFVDDRHSMKAPLAELLARKAFPESGHYESAGFEPDDALAPEFVSLAMDMGLDVSGNAQTKLDKRALSRFHVVVWLDGETSENTIDEVPHHTVLLKWTLPKLSDAKDVQTGLRDMSNALSAQIRDLMVTMRGEAAS